MNSARIAIATTDGITVSDHLAGSLVLSAERVCLCH